MLVSPEGVIQPAIGTKAHWTRFAELVLNADLFTPLLDRIIIEVSAAIAGAPPHGANIDSSILARRVLEAIGSWWHGEFSRRFRGFPNGAAAGVVGMVLWNYLAELPLDWWCFWEREDPHGYGDTHKRYAQLPPGHPMIPRGH